MGKFSGLLMVSDLDRTLFGDKSVKLILPENNTAIEYFIQNGGFFTFATGRSLVAARELTVDIPKNAPAILFNGQMIYDFNKNHILFSDEIYDENIKIFLGKMCEKFPFVPKVILYKDKMFTVNDDEATENMKKKINMQGSREDFRVLPLPWVKILLAADEATVEEMMSYSSTLDLTGIQCVCSTPTLMEVMKDGVSKATGLKKLSDILGIEMKNTIAVGDYYNDASMLKAAGHAFVPENAAEDLKPLAEKVVRHHREGAISAVVEYLDGKFTDKA